MWANKADSACHSCYPSGPHPIPRYYTDTRNYTHAIHTDKHARMYTKSSNAQLTTSQRRSSNLLSVNKQTPTYSSDKTDANMDFCSQRMLSPVIFQAACHLMSFMNDANYAYQLIPTSIKYFTNTPGCRHLLRVKPWKPC